MKNRIRRKLTGTYLLLIILVISIAGGIAYGRFQKDYSKSLEQSLTREAFLIAEISSIAEETGSSSYSYQKVCEHAAKDSMTRVTIIDQDGKVLGDSTFNVGKMDIHKSRPEVFQALKGEVGVSRRYSNTAQTDMLYVAVPFHHQTTSGVVRLSMPLTDLKATNGRILSILLMAILIAGLTALLLSIAMAGWFSRPIMDITEAVREMSRGNFKKRIPYNSNDELGFLTEAFNDMGDHLENSIHEISQINNLLATLLENTINGIFMVDTSGKLSYVNPMAQSLLGLPDPVSGRNYVEIINDYELLQTIDRVREDDRPIRKDITMHILGAKVVEVSAIPIKSSDLTHQGVMVVLHDITETKRLDKVRKDFVANVSHELKTPVATISGFSETLLEEGVNESDNTEEFIRIIYDESQRLSRLISRLLELSKLESEESKAEKASLDLNEIIRDTIDIMRNRTLQKDISIRYEKPEMILTVNSNAEAIGSVLINLIDNAIKYTQDGGEIRVGVETLESSLKIRVADNGIGIPEKDLSRVFERFYRVDKDRCRKTGGTGLGLSIVKHLVENLGGQVGVESVLGQGSTFFFTLPIE